MRGIVVMASVIPGFAAAGLLTGSAWAEGALLSSEERCESRKLQARAAYTRCLSHEINISRALGAHPDFHDCDERYWARFERIEGQTGVTCFSEDELATLEAIKTETTLAAGGEFFDDNSPCETITSEAKGTSTQFYCDMSRSNASTTFQAIVEQIVAEKRGDSKRDRH